MKKSIIHALKLEVHTGSSPLSTDASVFNSRADKVKAVVMKTANMGGSNELQNPLVRISANCLASPDSLTLTGCHTRASIRIYWAISFIIT